MSDDRPDGQTATPARPRHFHPRIAAICALVALIIVIITAFVASSMSSSTSAKADTSANRPGIIGLRQQTTGDAVGQPLPAAGLVRLDGSITDLKTLVAGRPTLVNFFSSTCTGCITEMPALQRLAATTHGKLNVIGIDVQDTRDDTMKFVKKTGVSYPVARDPQALVLSAWNIGTIPTTIAVTSTGHIVAQHHTFEKGELDPFVAKYLKITP